MQSLKSHLQPKPYPNPTPETTVQGLGFRVLGFRVSKPSNRGFRVEGFRASGLELAPNLEPEERERSASTNAQPKQETRDP